MSNAQHYTFKCYDDNEEDESVIKALSSAKNKTDFIKMCIRAYLNNQGIEDKLAEINDKFDALNKTLVNTKFNPIVMAATVDVVKVKETVKNQQDVTIVDSQQDPSEMQNSKPQILETGEDIKKVKNEIMEESLEENSQVDKELRKNIFSCMSRFTNM